jgi:hypothetical protein
MQIDRMEVAWTSGEGPIGESMPALIVGVQESGSFAFAAQP